MAQPRSIPAQTATPIAVQLSRQSVIHFAPCNVQPAVQDIELAPGIIVPDIPAGGSNPGNDDDDDDICMAALDEFEKQKSSGTITG